MLSAHVPFQRTRFTKSFIALIAFVRSLVRVVVVVVVVMSFFQVFDVKNRREKKTCLFALKKKSQGGKLLFSSLKYNVIETKE